MGAILASTHRRFRSEAAGISRVELWVILAMLFVIVFRLHELAPSVSRILRPAFLAGPVGLTIMLLRAPSGTVNRLLGDSTVRMLIALILWAALSVPGSVYRSLSLTTVQGMLPLLFLVCAFLLLPPRADALESMCTAFAVLGGILALAALTVGDMSTGRLQVTMTLDPNDLGAMMSLTVPFALGLTSRGSWWRRVGGYLIVAASVMVLLKTSSRGSTLGVATGALAYSMLSPGAARWRRLALLAVGGLIAWQYAPDSYKSRMMTLSDVNSDYNATDYGGRVQLWKRGMEYARANPIFGVGAGAFAVAEGNRLEEIGTRGKWNPAHNAYVQAAAELGYPGLVLFVALFIVSIRKSFALASVPFQRAKPVQCFPEIAAALLGFALSAFFLSMTFFWALYALFGVSALGKLVSTRGTRRARVVPQVRVRGQALAV